MKITKKMIYNILFYGFIIFLFTPYGKGTKAKIIQGVSYVKTMIFSPKSIDIKERKNISTLDLPLKAIHSGTDFNLIDKKGKVILINHWATWCPPCIGEMPSFQKLYNDYNDKIVFVFLTSDNQVKVDTFYKKNNYTLPTFNAMSSPAPEINSRTLPTTFIVDKNGKLALKDVGAANWNSSSVRAMLDRLIAE